jgi:hypothetical protein
VVRWVNEIEALGADNVQRMKCNGAYPERIRKLKMIELMNVLRILSSVSSGRR